MCKADCDCKKVRRFSDSIRYDAETKTVVSCRDGTMDYFGYELGIEPRDKVFKVWRSADSLKALAAVMPGLELREGHNDAAPAVGKILDCEIVGIRDELTATTAALRHKAELSDSILGMIAGGHRQVSLDYDAELVQNADYDFEQTNIRPKYLAILPAGRCGPVCGFADGERGGKGMKKLLKVLKGFKDQEGTEASLQTIVEIVAALPEAIKTVPLPQLQEIVPSLLAIIEAAKGAGAELPAAEPDGQDEAPDDKEKKEVEDMGNEDTKKIADGKTVFSADQVQAKVDAALKDGVSKAIKDYAAVVERAREFAPEGYSFAGKDALTIMRDCIKAQGHDQEFTDAETVTAFKLLKPKAGDYRSFGDAKLGDGLAALADKEIGQ